MVRSEAIYGNKMKESVRKKAERVKQKYRRKFGNDQDVFYPMHLVENKYIGKSLGVKNLEITEEIEEEFDLEKGIIIGNIRMGYGHYRISMAIASAVTAMGYKPYWMDLNSYEQTVGGKIIRSQNKLYSIGSRISGKSKLFNRFIWEPVNYEGFRQLSYNAVDQKTAELMTTVFKNIPKEIPFIATHVWPAQAAVHSNMKYVVNAVPDNWPMALHLAEGSIHTVQTYSAYLGYRMLNGMGGKKVLHPMKSDDIYYTGHYVDHELVTHIEADCEARINRMRKGQPMRFLLTIGGAGAQVELFSEFIRYVMPFVKENRVAIYINVGDYKAVWDELVKRNPQMQEEVTLHFEDFERTEIFSNHAIVAPVYGIHGFCFSNIFEAVYTTNLLMRSADVLVTKPSELAYYPIPKLFMKRVGGHEKWGAIHSAELGDGTIECEDINHVIQMVQIFLEDKTLLEQMCNCILENKKRGIYDGAYKVVELAIKEKKSNVSV